MHIKKTGQVIVSEFGSNTFTVISTPGVGSMGKNHGIHGETMVSPCFPCFPILLWKSMGIFFRQHQQSLDNSVETMGHHLLVILNCMENHGKHGTAFFLYYRQHGKA